MKKWILVGILAIVASLCIMPAAALADTTDTITITATGSEISIAVDTAGWNVGYVQVSEVAATGIIASWATLTNSGAEAVDVSIGGGDMENAAGNHTWTISETFSGGPPTVPTVGSDIFGMCAGLDDGDDTYDIEIWKVGSTLIDLVDELATGTQDFGLKFWAPSSMSYYEVMEMVGAEGTAADEPRGLVLTGYLD